MSVWAALAGKLLAVALLLSAVFFPGLTNPAHAADHSAAHSTDGTAHITQSHYSNGSTQEYDTSFGENWESVRTFRLLSTLDKPLQVYLDEHPSNASLYQPQYRQYVLDSLKVWSNALNGRLRYTLTSNPKQADITVHWVSAFDDRYVAGITNYSVGHAEVMIKTVDVPDKDIKCNIMHEFGHALGISGHSTNANDIMVGVRRWRRDNAQYNPTLSARDMQAIRRLYSLSWQKGEDLYAAMAQSEPIAHSQTVSKPSAPSIKPAPHPVESLMVARPLDLDNSAAVRTSTNP